MFLVCTVRRLFPIIYTNTLKISIFTHNFPPEIGAAPWRLHYMAVGLAKAGHDVEVYTGFPNYPQGHIQSPYRGKWFQREVHPHFILYRHGLYPLKSNGKAHRLLNMLSLAVSIFLSLPHVLRKRPQVCIVQCPPLLLPFSVWVLAKLSGAKFIVNVSDLWPSATLDLGVLKSGRLYRTLLYAADMLYRRADGCMGQSEEIIAYLRALGQKSVLLYRTGAQIERFSARLVSASRPLDAPRKLVYVGTLGLAQNICAVVKATNFSALGWELHIFGEGFEREALVSYLVHTPRPDVFLHAAVAPEQVPDVLQRHDAALVCQKAYVRGTLPSKLYEAMAASLPVLFHGAGEGARIVQQAACGLVSAPAHTEQLAENLQRLATHSADERRRMGQRGRAFCAQHFDSALQMKALLAWLG